MATYSRGACVSGLDDVQHYSASVLSLAKQELIKGFAQDFAEKIKLQGIDSGSDTSKIVLSFKEKIPNPKRNKKQFSSDEARQREACLAIAAIVNKQVGKTVVDTSASSDEICSKTVEVLTSVFRSIAGELAAVKSDVTNVQSNLHKLRDLLESNYNALYKSAPSGSPLANTIKTDYSEVEAEIFRHKKSLLSILDDIKSGIKEVDVLESEFRQDCAAAKSITTNDGNRKYGAKLAYTLSCFGDVATCAKLVDDILIEAGKTHVLYAAAKPYADLRNVLSAEDVGTISKKDLAKYEDAKQALYKFQYLRNIEGLVAKTGSSEDNVPIGGLELDSAVTKNREAKRELLRSFITSLATHFESMLVAADKIAKYVGEGRMKSSDELEKFAQAIDMIPPIDKQYYYLALSGYDKSSTATEEREIFISKLRHVVNTCLELSKHKDYSQFSEFKEIATSMDGLIKSVADTSSKFETGFATLDVYGSAEDLPSNIVRVGVDLEKVKTIIMYFTRVAKIKDGLQRSHKEVHSVREKYDKVLGDAIAERLEATQKEAKEFIDKFDNDPLLKNLFTGNNAEVAKDKLKDAHKKFYSVKINMYKTAEAVDLYLASFTDAVTAHPEELKSIMEMLNNVEIISKWFNNSSGDMLCNVFDSFPAAYDGSTPVMAGLIDKYLDYKDMHYYERVALICRMGEGNFTTPKQNVGHKDFNSPKYLEVTDKLKAYPTWHAAAGALPKSGNALATDGTPSSMSFPGNPFLGMPVFNPNNEEPKLFQTTDFRKLEDMLDKCLSVNILKNIISIFVNVADKFSSGKLSDKAIMAPMQIFKNLCEYMKYSAITCGIEGHELAKDVTLKGFNHVKNAVKRVDNGVAPAAKDKLFDGSRTYASSGDDKIRIGVEGSVIFSGSHRNALGNIKNQISELSGLASRAVSSYKKAIADLGELKTGNNTLLKTINDIRAVKIAAINNAYVGIPIEDKNKDSFASAMKNSADSLVSAVKWYNTLSSIIGEITYFSNLIGNNKQVKEYLTKMLLSSNIQEQITNICKLFSKTGNLGANAAVPIDELPPHKIVLYLACPSDAGAGVAYNPNDVTGDTKYYPLVQKYLHPVCTRNILGVFQEGLISEAIIQGVNLNAFIDVAQLRAPSTCNGVLKSWDVTNITNSLMEQLKRDKESDSKFRKDEVLLKEMGSVAMRGVGEFESRSKRLTRISNSMKDKTDNVALGSIFSDNYSPFRDIFTETDELFIMCIKGIVAKILTAIGTFNMFHRQYNPDGAGYKSGLRTILGGADLSGNVQIIDEAIELYVRIPLLVEFYKSVMGIEKDRKIAFIPEMNNIFGGLLTLIFVRNKDTKEGNYTESDIREIIKECNKIYVARKDKSISEIVNEFISEVNARYGLISTRDVALYNEYMEGVDKKRHEFESIGDAALGYDEIFDPALKGLDEDAVSKRKAPSDSFLSEGAKSASLTEHKYKINNASRRAALRELRKNVDDALKLEGTTKSLEAIRLQSMNAALISSKEELRTALNNEEKYRIVRAAITGFSQSSLPVVDKAYLMLHEFAVTPLCTLKALHTLVDTFNTNITVMACIAEGVDEWVKHCAGNVGTIFKDGTNGSVWHHVGVAHKNYFGIDMEDKYYVPFLHGAKINAIPAAHGAGGAAVVGGASFNGAIIAGTRSARQGYLMSNPANEEKFVYYDGANKSLESIAKTDPANLTLENKIARLTMLHMFMFDLGAVFTALFENLNTFAQNLENLIDVNIDASYDSAKGVSHISVALTTNNLKEYVPSVLSSVKKVLNGLRSMIPQIELKKIEREWDYSVYRVENLFHKLFKNEESPNLRIDLLNSKITDVLSKLLTYKFQTNAKVFVGNGANDALFKASAVVGAGAGNPGPITTPAVLYDDRAGYVETNTEFWPYEFDREMYRLILWDNSRNQFIANGSKLTVKDLHGADWTVSDVNDSCYTCINALDIADTGLTPSDASTIKNIFKIAFSPDQPPTTKKDLVKLDNFANSAGYAESLYDYKTGFRNDSRRSIVIDFNRAVALYLNVIFDPSSVRVYKNTIESFVNESFSHEVRGDKNINDLSPTNIVTKQWTTIFATKELASLDHEGVLCRSLATLFKILYTQTVKGKPDTRYYLESDLNNLPTFLKERYRGGFPVLIRIFKNLIKRCELLKPFVYNLNVAQTTSTNQNGATNIDPLNKLNNTGNFNDCLQKTRQKLVFYLDEVIIGSRSLIKCMETTLGEMGYAPKYLELYKTYFADFRATNGRDPVTPLSSILRLLANSKFGTNLNDLQRDSYDLVQLNSGVEEFKFLYGIGLLMSKSQIKLDDMPGLKLIIDSYNKAVDEKNKLPEDELVKLVNNTLIGLMYSTDIIKIKALLKNFNTTTGYGDGKTSTTGSRDPAGNSIMFDVEQGLKLVAEVADKDKIPAQFTQNIPEIINIPNNVKEFMSRVINLLGKYTTDTPQRKLLIAKNIADLNVVPINVNALMREVPLINLYNYSDTFDQMICDTLGHYGCSGASKLDASKFNDDLNAGKSLLCHMMCDPYIGMDFDVYDAYFGRIMRGNLGVEGLGRPKYIADEIYNKPLFGEVIANDEYKREGGPADSDSYEEAVTRSFSLDDLKELFVVMAIASFGATGHTDATLNLGTTAGHGFGRGLLPQFTDLAMDDAVLEGDRAVHAGGDGAHVKTHTINMLKAIWDKVIIDNNSQNISAEMIETAVKNLVAVNKKDLMELSYLTGGNTTPVSFDTAAGHGLNANIASTQLALYLDHLRTYLTTNQKAHAYISEYTRSQQGDVAAGANDATIRGTIVGKLMVDFSNNLETHVKSNPLYPSILSIASTNNDIMRYIPNYVHHPPPHIPEFIDELCDALNTHAEVQNVLKGFLKVANRADANEVLRLKLIKEIHKVKPAIFRGGSALQISLNGNILGNILNAPAIGGAHPNSDAAVNALDATAFNAADASGNLASMGAAAYKAGATADDCLFNMVKEACAGNTYTNIVGSIILVASWQGNPQASKLYVLANTHNVLHKHDPKLMYPQRRGTADTAQNVELGAADLGADGADHIFSGAVADINAASKKLQNIRISNNKFTHAMHNFHADTSLIPKYVTPYLHWMQNNDVKKVYVGGHKYMLKYLGKMRFDTVLVRNLIWLANIQRLLRLKLRRDLTWYDDKIVTQHAVTASSITELHGNDTADMRGITSKNYNPYLY